MSNVRSVKLTHKQRLTARQKADLGMYLSMRELAEVTGFSEHKMNAFKKMDGFPLFEKKATLQDFNPWAASNFRPAAEIEPCSQMASNLPHLGACKSYELFR